jgi:hypothetical protein
MKTLQALGNYNMQWRLDDLHHRNCSFCNSNEEKIKYIRPYSLNVKLCELCQTYYISPAPS